MTRYHLGSKLALGAFITNASLALFATGCSFNDVGCVSDADCREGRVCAAGACKSPDGFDLTDTFENSEQNAASNSNVGDNATPNGATNNTAANNAIANNTASNASQGNNIATNNAAANNMATNNATPNNTAANNTAANNNTPDPDMGTWGEDMGSDTPDMSAGEPDMSSPDPVLGPQIEVTPSDEINFGIVTVGQTTQATLNVSNIGDAPLELYSVDLASRPSQGFDVQPVITPQVVETVAPGATKPFLVTFSPNQQSGWGNSVIIKSNDADLDDAEIEVELSGRSLPPTSQKCLTVNPEPLDFGLVPAGTSRTLSVTLGNCSTAEPVRVSDVYLDDGGNGFSLVNPPMIPMTLAVGQSQTVDVRFDSTGMDEDDELVVVSDSAFFSRRSIDLFAEGGECPEAIALGESVMDSLGQDALHEGLVALTLGDSVALDGTASESSSGQLTYSWRVISAPGGSTAAVSPSTSGVTTFTPDLAGNYELELDVRDTVIGLQACDPATIEVAVMASTPNAKISVYWNASHDVDLHVLRTEVMGGWPRFGDDFNDVYYDNLHPDWGAPGIANDGIHLGDDTDGFGPEVVVIDELEVNRDYQVIAQFARNDGFMPFEFDVTAEVEIVNPNGQPLSSSSTHTFRLNRRGERWIAFEIDGATGAILPINTTF